MEITEEFLQITASLFDLLIKYPEIKFPIFYIRLLSKIIGIIIIYKSVIYVLINKFNSAVYSQYFFNL